MVDRDDAEKALRSAKRLEYFWAKLLGPTEEHHVALWMPCVTTTEPLGTAESMSEPSAD